MHSLETTSIVRALPFTLSLDCAGSLGLSAILLQSRKVCSSCTARWSALLSWQPPQR